MSILKHSNFTRFHQNILEHYKLFALFQIITLDFIVHFAVYHIVAFNADQILVLSLFHMLSFQIIIKMVKILQHFPIGSLYNTNVFLLDRPNSYWIGLQRHSSNCQSNELFSCWNDGTPVGCNNLWSPDEPSSDIDGEDCVVIGHPRFQKGNSTYLMYNIPCKGVFHEQLFYLASFICQTKIGKF